MRVKRRHTEQWMALLPQNLKKRIQSHEQYRWQETIGVDEEGLPKNVPKDLRGEIKQQLCRSLLTRVFSHIFTWFCYIYKQNPVSCIHISRSRLSGGCSYRFSGNLESCQCNFSNLKCHWISMAPGTWTHMLFLQPAATSLSWKHCSDMVPISPCFKAELDCI